MACWRMKSLWPWLSAALTGVLLTLCYAPADLGGLSWIALTPLICAAWFPAPWAKYESERLFLLGYITGLGYFWGSLSWLISVTFGGWLVLGLYLAIYPALWALFLGTLARPREKPGDAKPVWLSSWNNLRVAALAAAAWVGLEWIRGMLFTGFGWNSLGVALHENIALMQICDFTGVGGLSFLLVMVNVMAVATVKRLIVEARGRAGKTGTSERIRLRPHYDFSLTVMLVALAFAYGVRAMMAPPPPAKPLNFAAIQASVPISVKRDSRQEQAILDLHAELSEKALAMHPDLLIWPEAATPQPLFSDKRSWETVHELLQKHDGDFLTGTVHLSRMGDFNSAALMTGKGKGIMLYHKVHLVPFGEYVPLRHSFPLFAWIVGNLVPDDFDFGPRPIVLEMKRKPFRLATLICFEDTLGDLARQFAAMNAQVFITLTNDAWFERSAGSRQHLANAVFRCAETKLPMIRAANTGVTCVVDRFGRVVNELQDEKGGTFSQGFLSAQVNLPIKPAKTFYTLNGEAFSLACLILATVASAIYMIRRRRS